MNCNLILANVAKHIELDQKEIIFFTSLLQHKTLGKKQVLLAAGEPCTAICYVNSGALRAYYEDPDQNESTIMFAVADWWITDMPCFVSQAPAMITIEAVEETDVWLLSGKDMEELFISVPKFERFFRILMQNAYVREQLRVLQNLSMSAEERYASFLKKYPLIANQVAQKHIATYLGITPEFLSAIRGKMRKGTIS